MSVPPTPAQPRVWIYCDGGFGNRLNALFSGLALARLVGWPSTVIWPRNNWCQAAFEDIFDVALDVDERSLSELAGAIDHMVPLLHDQLGADALRVPFRSAYDYASVADFTERVVVSGHDVFFYPALIPNWIPITEVAHEMRFCQYRDDIREAVIRFLRDEIAGPFYGLHLRRTDLAVGYSDEEVQAIVRGHPDARFFVCSDDPIAEAIAAVHPNVVTRSKQAYVGKRQLDGGWNAMTPDDDGRVYASNIDRSAASVIEAVIDLLILAHGEIVGFSGSTFQNIARLYGVHAPLTELQKPSAPIDYPSMNVLERMLRSGVLTVAQAAEKSVAMDRATERTRAIALARLALEHAASCGQHDVHVLLLHHNLGALLINDGRPYEATCCLIAGLALFPANPQLQALLTAAQVRGGFKASS